VIYLNKRIRKKQQNYIEKNKSSENNHHKSKLFKLDKKWLAIIVIAITMTGMFILLGTSYAYLYKTLRGQKSYSLKVKGFNLRLDETGSSNIKIENSIPVSDSEGKQTNPYNFSIANEDSNETGYIIYIDDETIDSEINRMKDTVVKYQLIENGKETVGLVSGLGTSPFRILTSGVINGNTTNIYSLRFWIKEGAEVSTNQVFNVKLRVIATSKEAIEEGKLVFGDTVITSDNGVTSMTSDELQNYIDKASENKIEAVIRKHEATEAGYHNSIFRGKDVTSYYEDGSLYERISNGTFKDLYVGDYIIKNNITWRIAGFDLSLTLLGNSHHHAIIIPDSTLENATMNDTDTTTGGYAESKMYKEVLPNILDTVITPIFGNHVLPYSVILSTSVDSICHNENNSSFGCSIAWNWYTDRKLDLMNEVQVYGSAIWVVNIYDVGNESFQFPLFKLSPQYVSGINNLYWLRVVGSNGTFISVDPAGTRSFSNASTSIGVRPYFYIG